MSNTVDAARVLLYTGKGGVGKTSIAAATALRCADAGSRVLVLSTDPAHSLADALDAPLGSEPTPITSTLSGLQLDAQERMEESWGEIQGYLVDVLDWAGAEGIEAEELSVLPGMDELFSLVDIKQHATSGRWDVVVVDCAPTAETIRLLSLPDLLDWYMERVFPVGRRLNRLVGPILSKVSSLPVAGDEVFGATRRFYDRMEGVKPLLTDRERTSVRLVVNPERIVVAEARRTYTYLSLFGYRVDAVLVNRVLPEAVADPWFDRWRTLQRDHLDEIHSGFAPLPVLKAELQQEEVVGAARLRDLAERLYGDIDPTGVLHRGEPMSVERTATGYELVHLLPFADHDDLELGRRDGDLLVRVGPYRRAVHLPDSLKRRPVEAASLRDGVLRVTFGTRAGGAADLAGRTGR